MDFEKFPRHKKPKPRFRVSGGGGGLAQAPVDRLDWPVGPGCHGSERPQVFRPFGEVDVWIAGVAELNDWRGITAIGFVPESTGSCEWIVS